MHRIEARDYEAMSQEAADFICAELEQKPHLLLCASAGNTPNGAYAQLAARHARQPALFSKLRVLQIDEWGGLRRDNPRMRAMLQGFSVNTGDELGTYQSDLHRFVHISLLYRKPETPSCTPIAS
jgi:hypothetical protein